VTRCLSLNVSAAAIDVLHDDATSRRFAVDMIQFSSEKRRIHRNEYDASERGAKLDQNPIWAVGSPQGNVVAGDAPTPMALLRAGFGEQPRLERGVRSSGSGQLSPAAWKRLTVARTVDAATPIRRAISRVDTPPTNLSRSTSRTWRMVVLSAGIRSLLRKSKGADLSRPAEAPPPPGEIIPEWWATSSRNGGRDHLGIGGRLHPGMVGGFTRNPHPSGSFDGSGAFRCPPSWQTIKVSVGRGRNGPKVTHPANQMAKCSQGTGPL
jgi:hypothetical protein